MKGRVRAIRLDARPADLGGPHGKRGMFGGFLAQLRDSPGEALFNVGFKARALRQ